MTTVIGWDIGGVNTKAAVVAGGRVVAATGRPFEIRRAPDGLTAVLRQVLEGIRREIALHVPPLEPGPVRHAVTMTAELARVFQTKAEGVAFVLDAVDAAFSGSEVQVWGTDGVWRPPDAARTAWRAVASANWAATARLVARRHPDALLVDIGTTTTDVIPVAGGAVVADGWTDPDRLASGELLYTGVLRTPVEAMASAVRIGQRRLALAAEGFALAGDVHVWRRRLAGEHYTVPTPDGRPADREWCGERLRRAVCADRVLMSDGEVDALADGLAAAQRATVAQAIARVGARHRGCERVVAAGLGAFAAVEAATLAGCPSLVLADVLGDAAARHAAAAAVALLLAETPPVIGGAEGVARSSEPRAAFVVEPSASPDVAVVVKVGGSLVRHPDVLRDLMQRLARLASIAPVVVVPGGGPMADAVRAVDQRLGLSASAAHWMAVTAMDQYAEALADLVPACELVRDRAGVRTAVATGKLAVIAPAAWLRSADPLPHTWDVTGDSLAAWFAGTLGAPRLVLMKAPGTTDGGTDPRVLADAWLPQALPPHLAVDIVAADDRTAWGRVVAPFTMPD